ncbi:hypothetical protein [Flavobacterium sp. JAS]|uniref:hypothetical protein n=1 Tax=Flavobacterium sp. JAS TaxID=2897329 RepID=UPI001E2FDF31|nr:hypothetical protein [Flavobacterium sp. JAS]MCD0472405.1 hypothetical protein [Flavobacterium sp. JAS]
MMEDTEESLDNIPKSQSEDYFQPENITTNPDQESENMEVHHHTHPAHGKKKWNDYFWEFLMLFLAVFCGFLAEYYLEHRIEADREEVYINSLIEDLQKDSTNLAFVIKEFQSVDKSFDTILKMYPKISTGYNETLHRNLWDVSSYYPDFVYSDRTMQQLKNSGAMRLIQNKKVADGILNYDSEVRDLTNIDVPFVIVELENSKQIRRELFDRQDLEIDWKTKSIAEMENGTKNYLLTEDKALLGQYNNTLRDLKHQYKMIMKKEMALNNDANKLIALIKTEYHIK